MNGLQLSNDSIQDNSASIPIQGPPPTSRLAGLGDAALYQMMNNPVTRTFEELQSKEDNLIEASGINHPSQMLDKDAWEKSPYYREGLDYNKLANSQGLVSPDSAQRSADDVDSQDYLQQKIANMPSGVLSSSTKYLGYVLGGLTDPFNDIGAEVGIGIVGRFIPKSLFADTATTMAGRIAQNVTTGVVKGAAEGAIASIPQAVATYSQNELGEDTSAWEALSTIGVGAGLGAIAHGVVGAYRGIRPLTTPGTHETAINTAVSQIMEGKTPDVGDILKQGYADQRTLESEKASQATVSNNMPQDTGSAPIGNENPTNTSDITANADLPVRPNTEVSDSSVNQSSTMYHGSSQAEISPVHNHYSSQNYYGNGFYTTDSPEIAKGYSKKGSSVTGNQNIFTAKENTPAKLYDMEKPLSSDIKSMITDEFADNHDIDNIVSDTLAGEENGGSMGYDAPKNMREFYDNLRDNLTGEGYSRDTTQEVFERIRSNLEKMGYDGLTHIGGLRTNKPPHKVNIYFKPENLLIDKVSNINDLLNHFPGKNVTSDDIKSTLNKLNSPENHMLYDDEYAEQLTKNTPESLDLSDEEVEQQLKEHENNPNLSDEDKGIIGNLRLEESKASKVSSGIKGFINCALGRGE